MEIKFLLAQDYSVNMGSVLLVIGTPDREAFMPRQHVCAPGPPYIFRTGEVNLLSFSRPFACNWITKSCDIFRLGTHIEFLENPIKSLDKSGFLKTDTLILS